MAEKVGLTTSHVLSHGGSSRNRGYIVEWSIASSNMKLTFDTPRPACPSSCTLVRVELEDGETSQSDGYGNGIDADEYGTECGESFLGRFVRKELELCKGSTHASKLRSSECSRKW